MKIGNYSIDMRIARHYNRPTEKEVLTTKVWFFSALCIKADYQHEGV